MRMIQPIVDPFSTSLYAFPEFIETFVDTFSLPHLVSPTTVGQLESSSHQPNGSAFFGTGNSTAHFEHLFDHTSNIEFGLQDHYRTGDYVNPVNGENGYVATMDAGIQNGQHNELGSNPNRSGASFDISMNFGNEGPTAGKFVLDLQGHDFTLQGSGRIWYFADSNGRPVQGLTLSPDGHVLQDSGNLAFYSGYLQHGANPADISPQERRIGPTGPRNSMVSLKKGCTHSSKYAWSCTIPASRSRRPLCRAIWMASNGPLSG